MADDFIQVAPDSTGKKMEMSALTRADGIVVERERVAIGDPVNIGGLANVGPRGLQVDNQMLDLLREVLIELRVITTILGAGLNVQDDPNTIRGDFSLLSTIQQ
jgi:hypothetical protein